MINFDDIVNQNKRGNNPKWPQEVLDEEKEMYY